MGDVISLRLPPPSKPDLSLEAAKRWALAELGPDESITPDRIRAVAVHELQKPRDAIHARWASILLEEIGI